MVIFNSYVKLPEGKSTGICGNGRHPRPVCSPHPGSQHQSSLQDDVAEIWQTTGSAIYYLHAVRANPFNTSAMPQSVMFGVFFADHSDIRGHCSEMDGPVVILVIYSNLITAVKKEPALYGFIVFFFFWGRKLAKALFKDFPQRLHMRGLFLELLDHCNVLPG